MKENLLKKSRMMKESGITLIALVVSIVVILLLAGVTIATLTGDNGILSQAQNAQEKNQIAKFKDDVSMAYMEKYAEKAQEGDFTPITANDIVTKLMEGYGYKDNNLHRQVIGTVELEAPENGNIELATNSSTTVSVIPDDNSTKNYVKIGEKWYEFSITGDKVTVGEGMSELPDASENGGTSSLNASSNNSNVTAVADNGTKTVAISSNGTPTPQGTPAVITVSYGGSSITINVTVKQAYTLTLGSNNTTYGTVSVSPNAITSTEGANGTEYKYIAGTNVTVTANASDGYVFKGWYTGTDTTDDTKLISNAQSSYTINQLNADTTLTAKFGEINNDDSYADGFVDYLGTRATIYLYANAKKIKSGTITVTMPDANSTTSTITATSSNANIGPNTDSIKYYDTYTVAKDGTYSFQVKNNANNQTSTTVIKVEGIEKFTAIESLCTNDSDKLYNKDNKLVAYSYNGAAVPKGYYVDTNSKVADGLVITDDIDSEGYSTGNEWVWVPVNSTVGNADYYGTETSATALEGATDVTYTKYSKLYSFNGTTRETYGTFHDHGTNTVTLSRPSTKYSSGNSEIRILTHSTYGEGANYSSIINRITGTAFANVTDVATQYKNDYESMVSSVDKYHGFYIGRYEVTENGENPGVSLSGTISGKDWTWYTLYNKCLTFGKKDSNNVETTESSMMYGALWDATMQWLAKSGISVGYTGNTTSGYGNYNSEDVTVSNDKETNSTTIKVKASGTSTKLQTGQTSFTSKKNIYDLSGNCEDWTQEAGNTFSRAHRGGTYLSSDANATYSANRYNAAPTGKGDRLSSRPQLYIK